MPNVLRADAVTNPDDVLLHIAAVDMRELPGRLCAAPHRGTLGHYLLRLEAVVPPAPVPVRPTS